MAERKAVWPLGARIREAREAAGLGVNRAAKRANIAPTTWTAIEEGTRIRQGGGDHQRAKPSKPSVIAAALVVGLDVKEALALGGYDPVALADYEPITPEPAGWLELKVIRERDGWELGKLADAAGLSRETLRLYENGKRNPSASSVRALAEVLQVPFSVLAPSPRDNDDAVDDEVSAEVPAQASAEGPRARMRGPQPGRSQARMSGPQRARSTARMHSRSRHDEEAATPDGPESRPAESRP
jgi:transcriptional regulator with XRE-family HTH domain